MYHTLRMNQHLNLIGRYAEEPLRLRHLEALVHQGCRVDGNLGSHIPSRMLEGISCRHLLQLLMGIVAERTSRTSQENLVYLIVILAYQTLEDGTMLTIHWKDRRMILLCQSTNQFTCHYQGFLVGKTYLLASLDGVDGWFQTREAHHGGKHHIDRGSLYDVAKSLSTCIYLNIRFIAQQVLQLFVMCLIGDNNGSWMKLTSLCSKFLHSVVGCQAIYLIEVAMLLDDIQSLGADASGRTENTYLLFLHHFFISRVNAPLNRCLIPYYIYKGLICSL